MKKCQVLYIGLNIIEGELVKVISTSYHACIKLDKLLELTLKGMASFLEDDKGQPLTEVEIYQLVKNEKVNGNTYFCGCGHRDELGKCLGHITELEGDI